MTFNTWRWGFYFHGFGFSCGVEYDARSDHWASDFVKWQRGGFIVCWGTY